VCAHTPNQPPQLAKKQREAVGVELYGFQQTLAKLQMSLQTTQANHRSLSAARQQAEQDVAQLRTQLQEQQDATQQETQQACTQGGFCRV
jgi:ElaB/YqjD/DUF883 family membrane-anchored ribosome-binding protein